MNNFYVIGRNGTIPWFYKEDLKYFKEKTLGHCIVVGRKTYDSFPKKPLPGRVNIVLTHDESLKKNNYLMEPEEKEGLLYVTHIGEVFARCKQVEEDNLFVCGGAEIYKLFYDYLDEMLITVVNDNSNEAGDTKLELFNDNWEQDFNYTVNACFSNVKLRYLKFERKSKNV